MPLPTFLICGAEKAGTTALFNFMKGHPEISLSTEKELHYFSSNYEKGLEWYEGKFRVKKGAKAIGEASPSYMYDERVPERIKSTLPDVKLIFILRHPVDRAYSHYWHRVNRSGSENLSFEEAIKRAIEAEKKGVKEGEDAERISYLTRGKYAEHLERFKKVFPEERMLVLIHRDLKNKPEEVMRRVFEFIGVDPDFRGENWGEKHNVGITPKSQIADRMVKKIIFGNKAGIKFKFFMENHMPSVWKMFGKMLYREGYPPMKAKIRRVLLDYYEPHNRRLEKMIGRELKWWYE